MAGNLALIFARHNHGPNIARYESEDRETTRTNTQHKITKIATITQRKRTRETRSLKKEERKTSKHLPTRLPHVSARLLPRTVEPQSSGPSQRDWFLQQRIQFILLLDQIRLESFVVQTCSLEISCFSRSSASLLPAFSKFSVSPEQRAEEMKEKKPAANRTKKNRQTSSLSLVFLE